MKIRLRMMMLALGAFLFGLAACQIETQAEPEPETCETAAVLCPGADAPAWQLEDFQPASARTGQTYGLEAFGGKPVLVALLSGW